MWFECLTFTTTKDTRLLNLNISKVYQALKKKTRNLSTLNYH